MSRWGMLRVFTCVRGGWRRSVVYAVNPTLGDQTVYFCENVNIFLTRTAISY